MLQDALDRNRLSHIRVTASISLLEKFFLNLTDYKPDIIYDFASASLRIVSSHFKIDTKQR